MNIKSAQYVLGMDKKTKVSISAIINDKNFSVPLDPANTDYAEIMKQVKEGTLTIKDAD